MTLIGVANDEVARLAKLGLVAVRQGELFQRVKKGTLDPGWVADELQRIIHGKLGDAVAQIAGWKEFYSDVFGIQTDFSILRIPEKKAGLGRLIIVAPGMSPQLLYDKCVELFLCWKWTDESLDKIVQSERTSKDGAYAIWVCDRVEADEELKSLSADALKSRGILGVTLEERFLYELKYFEETGKHLDIINVTLCSGSRYSDGNVPNAYWNPRTGKFEVSRYNPGNSSPNLRSRAAVS